MRFLILRQFFILAIIPSFVVTFFADIEYIVSSLGARLASCQIQSLWQKLIQSLIDFAFCSCSSGNLLCDVP